MSATLPRLDLPTPPPTASDRQVRPVFLTAQWRHLLLLNFPAPADAVAPYLPAGLEVDDYYGETFVSIVGFTFSETRVLGFPVPGHRNFPEVNLRFYVRRRVEGELRRGVVFIREIVPRRLVAHIARIFYNENYGVQPMRAALPSSGTHSRLEGRVAYRWRSAGRWQGIAAELAGEPALPAPGSLEHFIIEHYWGYGTRRDGRTLEYGVEHPRWQISPVGDVEWSCDVAATYGPQFRTLLSRPPANAFYATGSPVVVRRPRVIDGD